jgi:phosphoglycolate phosphatase-like HAD superfamily hydrolase
MGYVISIVSNNDRENVLSVIRGFDLQDYFSNIVTASDVAKVKPDPEMILESAAQMDVSPAEMAVVGDSPVDAQAALRASSLFYGVLSGLSDEQRLRSAGARNVLPTVSSIVDKLSRKLD